MTSESDGYDGFGPYSFVIACEHAVVVRKRVGALACPKPEIRKPALCIDVIAPLRVLAHDLLKTTAGGFPVFIAQGSIGLLWIVFT